MPVTIPSSGINQRNNLGSLSQSPVSASPLGSLPNSFVQIQQQHRQEQQLQDVSTMYHITGIVESGVVILRALLLISKFRADLQSNLQAS